MPSPTLFSGRRLRLSYWSADARVVDSGSMALERHLSRLGEVQVTTAKTLAEVSTANCDLLIIAAQKIDDEAFAPWLAGLRGRMQRLGGIWLPVIILADIPFDGLSEIMPDAVRDNWYFDILAPQHMASLPIRVANLIRIHDHLQELKRYSAALEDVSAKVAQLENQMQVLKAAAP